MILRLHVKAAATLGVGAGGALGGQQALPQTSSGWDVRKNEPTAQGAKRPLGKNIYQMGPDRKGWSSQTPLRV